MKQSAALASLNTGDADVAMEPGTWTVVNTPAAATQSTASKAAAAAGIRHICRGIHASIACGATAQTPLRLVLRDGPTGTGTVIWSKKVSAPANSSVSIDVTGLCLVGTAATAMTLEFVGAGVAASEQDCTLTGVTMGA
jgi:hypothetical protein